MESEKFHKKLLSKLKVLPVLFFLILTSILAFSLYWNIEKVEKTIISLAENAAETAYKKDLLYRKWNARNSGVYVRVDSINHPNPHLNIPDREIESANGDKLTLIDPAYMTRQVFEMSEQVDVIKGKLTSLNPIRPGNKADEWESKALEKFKNQDDEFLEMVNYEAHRELRFIKAFVVEESCLHCHGAQGYKIGDVRGGISVTIPMNTYDEIKNSQIMALIYGHLLFWIAGSLLIVIGFYYFRITVKKFASQEEKYVEELKSLNENKDKIMAIISHDLRSPFHYILGSLEILLDDNEKLSESEQKNFLSNIYKSSWANFQLVANLLQWANSQKNKPRLAYTEFNLSNFIVETIEVYKLPFQMKELTFTNLIQASTMIHTDKGILSLIVRNLLNNALKFTPRGGRIEINSKVSDGLITVSVADSGMGMTGEQVKALFHGYSAETHRGTEGEKGTGLGLNLCKEFIKLLGGDISVKSELGVGTVFSFSIKHVS